MKCEKCNKIILDSLDYCPTCKINDNKNNTEINTDLDKFDKEIDELDILKLSVVFKFFYI